jgi:TfoX/Sxy family transcriptional regulator of competence genes
MSGVPFNHELADLLRLRFAGRTDVIEQPMFGGLSFMLGGKMCVGVLGDELVARVGAANSATALQEPHARPMDFTGRPMAGWVYLSRDGWVEPATLDEWVARCLANLEREPVRRSRPRRAPRPQRER